MAEKELTVKSKFFATEDKVVVNDEEVKEIAGTPSTADITTIANQAIQADKDILSQIVFEQADNDVNVIFPLGVFPIKYYDNNDDYVFFNYDNGTLTDYAGEDISGTFIITDSKKVCLVYSNTTEQIVRARFQDTTLLYLNVNGFDGGAEGNWYAILKPQPEGTKLYQHYVEWGGSYPEHTFKFITTVKDAFTKNTFDTFLESTITGSPSTQIPLINVNSRKVDFYLSGSDITLRDSNIIEIDSSAVKIKNKVVTISNGSATLQVVDLYSAGNTYNYFKDTVTEL